MVDTLSPNKYTLESLQKLCDLRDLADFLGYSPRKLGYILYALNGGVAGQYSSFKIKKRSGGARCIDAPHTALKLLQSRLSKILQIIYKEKKCVHGFVKNRSIITSALSHSRKRFVFRMDIKDFFPSIHFGRVLGLFQSSPYKCNRNIAILLAKIACYQDKLPQGSPCSPVISNMICAHMDSDITKLAKECGVFYTRYADDLTFSTRRKDFPEEIATKSGTVWEPGAYIKDIFKKHGFEINHDKTSMRTRTYRQMVTGLVVNDYPNIRRKILKQVRAMLHDWRVNGIDNAQKKHFEKFHIDNGPKNISKKEEPSFVNIVRGKIEFIRYVKTQRIKMLNKADREKGISTRTNITRHNQTIHKDQHHKYMKIYEALVIRDEGRPVILGEGLTDFLHLRNAFMSLQRKGLYESLQLSFFKNRAYNEGGVEYLRNFPDFCSENSIIFEHPVILVFDADIEDINKEHKEAFLSRGNNIFSLVIPRPTHRSNKKFSIEFLYKDNDLSRSDKQNRRLYLSTEFNKDTGKLLKDESVFYGKMEYIGKEVEALRKKLSGDKIIDDCVYKYKNGKPCNIALSKLNFAIQIIRAGNDVDYTGFEGLFNIIAEIIKTCAADSPQ